MLYMSTLKPIALAFNDIKILTISIDTSVRLETKASSLVGFTAFFVDILPPNCVNIIQIFLGFSLIKFPKWIFVKSIQTIVDTIKLHSILNLLSLLTCIFVVKRTERFLTHWNPIRNRINRSFLTKLDVCII